MFFKDNSTITVDCFTNSAVAYEYFPISKSTDYKPKWWNNLSSDFEVNVENTLRNKSATIKKCPGITNLFNKGLIIPSYCDLSMEVNCEESGPTFNYEFVGVNPRSKIDLHDQRQYLGVFEDKYIQAKITTPWLIKEKTGVEFLLTEPTWFLSDPNQYLVPPGVLDFKYQNNININLFLKLETQRIDIQSGVPLAQIIPLSDKKIKLNNHLVSDEEYEKLFELTQPFGWISSYKKRKKILTKKSCPFRF